MIQEVAERIHTDIKRGNISHIGGELRNVLYLAGEGSYFHIEQDSFEITLANGRKIAGLHLYHMESDTMLNTMN